MEAILQDDRGGYSIKGRNTLHSLGSLRDAGHLEKLSVTEIDLVTVRHIQQMASIRSVGWLWLWCDVTRRAMRHVIQLPGLTVLDVLSIQGPGELGCFSSARNLREFRANHYLTEQDLLQVAKCESLQEIGAQNSTLTHRSLAALLSLPHLRSLDIEATAFNDRMAKQLSYSKTISSLDIGATKLTGIGLRHIASMEGLHSLDLWATSIAEKDLVLLRELPQLEYISLGNYDGDVSLDPEQVVPVLMDLPSLKRIWIDGMFLTLDQIALLESKLEVRYTNWNDEP